MRQPFFISAKGEIMVLFYKIHRWVSLVCALFFLLLVLTGLPLLFRDEINAWNTVNLPQKSEPMAMHSIWEALPAGMEAVTAYAPDKRIRAVTPDPSDGTLYFLMESAGKDKERAHMRMGGEQIMYDVRSGEVFNRKNRQYRIPALQSFLHEAHLLHVQMKMGGAGRDFLAVMCVLTLLSIISGLWIYAPLMKKLAFGKRRTTSTRLFCSDWHKLISVFTFGWAFLLTLSGIIIVCYSIGSDHYHREAPIVARQQLFMQQSETPHAYTPAESLAMIQNQFPDKVVISMELPQDDATPYAFHLAEPPAKATNFMLGEMAFLPQAEHAESVLVPVPTWMKAAPFFLNLHIHSHDLLAEKIFWALLILGTTAMVVTGGILYFTRWHNRIHAKHSPVKSNMAKPTAPWREPFFFGLLTLLALVPPMYGNAGDVIGLAAMGVLLIYAMYAIL